MSNHLLEQLEEKINSAIEAIELLRIQVEELEEKNQGLQKENTTLKGRQTEWEHSLTSLLGKLDSASLGKETLDAKKIERYEEIEEDMLV